MSDEVTVESENSWVLDSLIGFLNGPAWNVPVLTFIEQQSVIFDANDDVNDDEGDRPKEELSQLEREHRKIFNSYRRLVDHLLVAYMDDLGINIEQFQEALDSSESKFGEKLSQRFLEQIFSAANRGVFRRMMIQANIDLQLHALEILFRRFGFLPKSFEGITFGASSDEQIGDGENGELINLAIEERRKLENQRLRQNQLMNVALERAVENRQPELDELDRRQSIVQVENTPENEQDEENEEDGEQEDEEWLKAREIAMKKKDDPFSEADVEKRRAYLRTQRDAIIARKKRQRQKQLKEIEESEKAAKRPKSARAMRLAIGGEESGDTSIQKGLAFRKSLASKLKEEVISRSKI